MVGGELEKVRGKKLFRYIIFWQKIVKTNIFIGITYAGMMPNKTRNEKKKANRASFDFMLILTLRTGCKQVKEREVFVHEAYITH